MNGFPAKKFDWESRWQHDAWRVDDEMVFPMHAALMEVGLAPTAYDPQDDNKSQEGKSLIWWDRRLTPAETQMVERAYAHCWRNTQGRSDMNYEITDEEIERLYNVKRYDEKTWLCNECAALTPEPSRHDTWHTVGYS